ncbi:terminase gpA endonuclease subunit [Tropicimonas sp. IMCC34043]|uniref:terminase gpA endonuclease subunit n=1 Tax=Tropicimonas sp. IMCC34043 TaxID=2248760 RepID=UPI002101A7E6|nr:terminase gpA endonuclease subunit [Tropicimonas sp. IMCC34043]
MRLWLIGVDDTKGAIMARLSRGGSIRFSADLPPMWYEKLASERAVVRYSRGQRRTIARTSAISERSEARKTG